MKRVLFMTALCGVFALHADVIGYYRSICINDLAEDVVTVWGSQQVGCDNIVQALSNPQSEIASFQF